MSVLIGLAVASALGWIVTPVVTLLHEAGHAAAALALTRSRVRMTLGAPDRAQPLLRAGRLTVRSETLFGRGGGSVTLVDAPELPAWRWAAIVAAGPAADVATMAFAAVVAIRAYAAGDRPVVMVLAAALAVGALVSALSNGARVAHPTGDGGDDAHRPSDGEQLARLAGRTPITPATDDRPRIRAPFASALAIVFGLVMLIVVDDPGTGLPCLAGLGLVFGSALLRERDD